MWGIELGYDVVVQTATNADGSPLTAYGMHVLRLAREVQSGSGSVDLLWKNADTAAYIAVGRYIQMEAVESEWPEIANFRQGYGS